MAMCESMSSPSNFPVFCRNKQRYAAKSIAQKVVDRMKSQDGVEQKNLLHAYRCPECLFYHVGRAGKSKKQREYEARQERKANEASVQVPSAND